MAGIPTYREINEIHQLTGSALRTQNPLFHCFDMAQANDLAVSHLPPHRADFYTLAINLDTQGLSYTLNQTPFEQPQYFVLCVAPGQVTQWKKASNWLGYCLFFKSEFLHLPSEVNFLAQYPFFSIHETNLLPITPTQAESLLVNCRQLVAEQQLASPFSLPIMQATLQALLWQVRRVYEATRPQTSTAKAQAILTAQFQYLVNECFLTLTTVEAYADRLNITPNHLSQTIRQTTGQSAKSIITRRRLLEARYLLLYTADEIAQIAFQLGFVEPTHFIKFFKKATGSTPSAYRSQQYQ